MKISFSGPVKDASGALVVLAFEGGALSPAAQAADKASGGAITRALKAQRFAGKRGESLEFLALPGMDAGRVLLAGAGKAADMDAAGAEALGAGAVARYLTSGVKNLTLALDGLDKAKAGAGELAARAGFGALLRSYRFDHYRTTQKDEEKPSLTSVTVAGQDAAGAKKAFGPLDALAQGIFFARDLASEPPNVLYPASFAQRMKKKESLGLKVEILGEKEMTKLGMGALLGVGIGSARESQLVVIRWQGAADKKAAPIAFVGKGVCFDSGGISLKPGAGMWDMKWDMGGAAAVAGAMVTVAARKAKANVVGILGLVENMPDGAAQRPSDIVTSMSGQTIDVLNTDAEGRLVLADAVWYAQDRFKPKYMVDLATLTGAIMVALGGEYAGMFANDEGLADLLAKASKAEGEGLWRMPLGEGYEKKIRSPIADMQNIALEPGAGSSIGAVFIQKFVNGVPWAHLDVAGTVWSKEDKTLSPKGATGFGVRILDRLVKEAGEK